MSVPRGLPPPLTQLDIHFDGDGCWPDLQRKPYKAATITAIAGLEDATDGGKPGVTIRMEARDGTIVIGQTTMRLFLAAARAFRGRFGDLEDLE
jgi:hypothetical protein